MKRFVRMVAGATLGAAIAFGAPSANAADRGTIVYLVPTLLDEIQNTPKDIQILANYLLARYKMEVWSRTASA